MRLIHTADWHLGQTLHGHARTYEHQRFLDWLLDLLEAERADALVIAGDVFDVASPSSEAQAQYYRFLAAARRRCPALDVVVVGGNHDGAARLDAPAEILDALEIRVVGGLPLDEAGAPDLERALVPLTGADGEVAAWLLAVPFLRRRDLPAGAQDAEAKDQAHAQLVAGHRALYRALYEAAAARRAPHQALVATGHCYMADGLVSELSERKIQVGNQHALPPDIFDEGLAYVALGHLHRAQAVGGRDNVRYSGSPIPLSLTERHYEHQVVLVELDGPRFSRAEPRFVPRAVDVLYVPEEHQPLEMVLPQLEALPGPPEGSLPDDRARPFLEGRVLLDRAQPRLRQDVQDSLQGAWVRLMRIDVRRPEGPELMPSKVPTRELDSIEPLDVFVARYTEARGEPPPEALEHLFLELLEEVRREETA